MLVTVSTLIYLCAALATIGGAIVAVIKWRPIRRVIAWAYARTVGRFVAYIGAPRRDVARLEKVIAELRQELKRATEESESVQHRLQGEVTDIISTAEKRREWLLQVIRALWRHHDALELQVNALEGLINYILDEQGWVGRELAKRRIPEKVEHLRREAETRHLEIEAESEEAREAAIERGEDVYAEWQPP